MNHLMFNNKEYGPDIRCLSEMADVVFDQEWLKTADLKTPLYYMYRSLMLKDGFRYDITVIPSLMLGAEFVKTKGHFHPAQFGEIYEVIEGEAFYLMQKLKPGSENEIEDVYVVKASAGEKVLIPAFYGHTTINPSKEKTLKMADWVSNEFESFYQVYEKYRGACYYYTQNGWLKNQKYLSVPDLRFESPASFEPGKTLESLNIHLEKLSFLQGKIFDKPC